MITANRHCEACAVSWVDANNCPDCSHVGTDGPLAPMRQTFAAGPAITTASEQVLIEMVAACPCGTDATWQRVKVGESPPRHEWQIDCPNEMCREIGDVA